MAVNHQLNTEGDNPAIGLLICQEKDNVLAQYALESSNQPLGISEYELAQALPKDIKSSLPSIEDIENELNNNWKNFIYKKQKKKFKITYYKLTH